MLVQQLVNGVVIGAVYALFALGFALVLSVLGVLNIAQEALFTWGALVGLWVVVGLGAPIFVALPLAMLAGGVIGMLIDQLALRPLRVRGMRGWGDLNSLIASLGASTVLIAIGQLATKTQIERFPAGTFPTVFYTFNDIRMSLLQIMMIVVSVVLMLALQYFLGRTRLGKATRAVAFSETTSQLLGINSESAIKITLFISGALGAAAGVLIGLAFNQVHYLMGGPFLLKGFVIIVLSGFSSVPGVIAASMFIGIAEVYGVVWLGGVFRDAIPFAVLFLTLLIRPTGLFGTREEVHV